MTVSCRNPECTEHLLPKDVPPDPALEAVAVAGGGSCGACGHPVEVD